MTSRNRFAPIAALTDTDAYKLDHRRQYPEGTEYVLANYTNRGTRIEGFTGVVHFGLQAFLHSWLTEKWKPFFEADEDEVAALYEEFTTSVLGPNTIGADHIRELHRLGYLPLRFRAVPEGTVVPLRVPTFTVENTDPRFFWLTNYIETALSASYWHPSTTATLAARLRTLADEWAVKTTGSTAGVEFQFHDFSFRGMSGVDAAAASGAGHLLSFLGSDNLNVINFVNENYPGENGWILGSVAATEHSVMCAGASDAPRDENGKIDEIGTYQHLLDLYPTGIVSAVSDTYDLWEVITSVLPRLKDQILARDGKIVIRPDSGDPVEILTGTFQPTDENGQVTLDPEVSATLEKYKAENPDKITPEQKGVVELLWDIFGGTVNEQGYKVLDPHIGAIYGDSITYERAVQIFERLEAKGFASTNVVFGVGSYSYQYVTRDTFGSAIKATYVMIDGEGRVIFKDPATDKGGVKKSAKGRVAVVDRDGALELRDGEAGAEIEGTEEDLLKVVWENGAFIQMQSYADVREVLAGQKAVTA